MTSYALSSFSSVASRPRSTCSLSTRLEGIAVDVGRRQLSPVSGQAARDPGREMWDDRLLLGAPAGGRRANGHLHARRHLAALLVIVVGVVMCAAVVCLIVPTARVGSVDRGGFPFGV